MANVPYLPCSITKQSTKQAQTCCVSLTGRKVNPLDCRRSVADANNCSSSNSRDRDFKSLYAAMNLNS